MEIYTIGFTRKSAEEFFGKLKDAGIRQLLDIRLNNTSQLAAFAKQDDLRYFLKQICKIDYLHMPILAPTQEILDDFKKRKGDWDVYETGFNKLMVDRGIETTLKKQLFKKRSVLLCSECEPDFCHRRLVAEYLKHHWGNVDIKHL